MKVSTRIGRLVFAVALTGFGFEFLFYAAGTTPAPGAPWPALRMNPAFLVAGVFLLFPVLIATMRRPRLAAGVFGPLLFLYAAIEFGPSLLSAPQNPGLWTSAFEVFAISGAMLALAGASLGSNPLRRFGDCVFAISLAVFAAQHFIYDGAVAALIPAWIPVRPFLAWFTGTAMLAAALAIATGILAKLAGRLTGLMFLLWFVLIHLRGILAAPRNVNEWTNAFVCLAVGGGALVISELEVAKPKAT